MQATQGILAKGSAATLKPAGSARADADGANKRRADRVAGEIWIKTLDPMTNFIGSTADISADGMFVHCLNPLPAGTRCAVEIEVDGIEAECEAWVVRSLCEGRQGMGIVFKHPDMTFHHAAQALVDTCRRHGPDMHGSCTLRFGENL
jgi:hypothetical protein